MNKQQLDNLADAYITPKVKKGFWVKIKEKKIDIYTYDKDGNEIPHKNLIAYYPIIKCANGTSFPIDIYYKHKSTCIQAIDNFCLETGLEIREK